MEISEWQLAQELVLWTEAASRAVSTNNEIAFPAAFVAVRVLSEWQSRQSLFLISAAREAPRPASKANKLAAIRTAINREMPIRRKIGRNGGIGSTWLGESYP